MNGATETQNQKTETAPHAERGFIIPPANIAATADGYVLEVDMPGVDKSGLEITVEDNELTIVGRRTTELPESELCYCESPQADYRRVFEVGVDVDTANIKAEMHQGVLKLRLPKSEKAKPKQIQIT